MQHKPGVMIYFELLEIVRNLPKAQAGILFLAILEYGSTGKEPELPKTLQLLWPIVRMRLDTDHERYQQIAARRRYSAYTRWAKERGEEVLSFNEWLGQNLSELEEEALLS